LSPSAAAPDSAGTHSGWRWFSRLYLLACAVALALMLSTQRDSLASLKPESPWLIGIAIGLVALTHVFAILFTQALLQRLGSPLDLPTASKIHLRFLPARYLPGGIWHTVGRFEQLRRSGTSVRRASMLPLVESLAAVITALILALVLLKLPLGSAAWLSGSVLLMVVSLITACLYGGAAGRPLTGAVLSVLGFWACQQLAFGVFLLALGLQAAAQATGWWLVAWAIGHLAVFAPQGAGVSELAFAKLAGGGLEAALLVTAFRLIQATGDMLAWGTWQALHRRVPS
jgi:glycosyltransferase 2 family protein